MLDVNPSTVGIAVGEDADEIYQLHDTGEIFAYTGNPCVQYTCSGWRSISPRNDSSKETIRIWSDGGKLYRLDKQRGVLGRSQVLSYTGSGWENVDNKSRIGRSGHRRCAIVQAACSRNAHEEIANL